MDKNVGKTDKMIRYALSVLFIILAIKVSPIFWVLAIVSVVTAFMGMCGIYKLFGINTCKIK